MSRRIYTILKKAFGTTLIPSGSDLNNYKTVGRYYLNALSNYTNAPTGYNTNSAYMQVFKQYDPNSINYIEQRLTLGGDFIEFARRWGTNSWSAWRITGSAIDAIVEQSTSGIWTYRKWYSGIAECWNTELLSFTGSSVSGSLMGGYYAQLNNPSWGKFPFTFIKDPIIFGSGRLGSGTGFVGAGANKTTITAISCVGNQNSKSINGVSIRVTGRWK